MILYTQAGALRWHRRRVGYGRRHTGRSGGARGGSGAVRAAAAVAAGWLVLLGRCCGRRVIAPLGWPKGGTGMLPR